MIENEFSFWATSAISKFPDGVLVIDHSNKTSEETARMIVSFAIDYGFNAPHHQYDDVGALDMAMDEAIEYLSMNLPEGYWIGNDGEIGAFGIWESEDE